MMDAQSRELNQEKRLKLVSDIQRELESDVARPMLTWRMEIDDRSGSGRLLMDVR